MLARLVPPEKLQETPPEKPRPSSPPSSACCGGGDEQIKVRGIDDLLVVPRRCCNPIRGEKIVGYITRGKGVSVHSADLPERRRTCSTTPSGASTSSGSAGAEGGYEVRLAVEVEDRPGPSPR